MLGWAGSPTHQVLKQKSHNAYTEENREKPPPSSPQGRPAWACLGIRVAVVFSLVHAIGTICAEIEPQIWICHLTAANTVYRTRSASPTQPQGIAKRLEYGPLVVRSQNAIPVHNREPFHDCPS